MQDILREIKEKYLENLKAKKVEVENQQTSLAAQKYAEKKAGVDEESRQLDEKLAAFIQEKQVKLNEEINQKRQEVADKKVSLETFARSAAEAEASAEVAHVLQSFEKEIVAVERDLQQ